jgi:D-alanyl-D-alanine dipeptidase
MRWFVRHIFFVAAFLCISSCATGPAQTGRAPAAAGNVESDADFVDIKTICPSVIVDVKYATPDNFMKQTLYDSDRCYLRRGTARKLAAVQDYLQRYGLGLKIMDGYRPLSIQKKMWKALPDPSYVADPKAGSMHNRGAAVDVTLVDKNGNELPMGTGYDDFTERAHIDYKHLPAEILKRRGNLIYAMVRGGFVAFRTEWWHYADKEWEKYPVEDIGLTQL